MFNNILFDINEIKLSFWLIFSSLLYHKDHFIAQLSKLATLSIYKNILVFFKLPEMDFSCGSLPIYWSFFNVKLEEEVLLAGEGISWNFIETFSLLLILYMLFFTVLLGEGLLGVKEEDFRIFSLRCLGCANSLMRCLWWPEGFSGMQVVEFRRFKYLSIFRRIFCSTLLTLTTSWTTEWSLKFNKKDEGVKWDWTLEIIIQVHEEKTIIVENPIEKMQLSLNEVVKVIYLEKRKVFFLLMNQKSIEWIFNNTFNLYKSISYLNSFNWNNLFLF